MINPNLQSAIQSFIANEFHLEPEAVSPDLNFTSDLNLDPAAVSELVLRMEDTLNFILPDDISPEFETLADLYAALTPPEEDSPPYEQS